MTTLSAKREIAAGLSRLQRAALPRLAFALVCGRSPFFLGSVWVLLFIEIAWPLEPQSHLFHPPPQRSRADRTLINLAQMFCQNFHCPDSRTIAKPKWVAAQLAENSCRRNSGGHFWSATTNSVN